MTTVEIDTRKDSDSARDVLGRRDRYRLHLVVPARAKSHAAIPELARLALQHGKAASGVVPTQVRSRHFKQADGHAPRLLASRKVRECALPQATRHLAIDEIHKWLFGLPSGALVVVLTVDFEPRPESDLAEGVRTLCQDLGDGHALTVDGSKSLLASCLDVAPAPIAKAAKGVELSVDSHRLLVLKEGAAGVFDSGGETNSTLVSRLGSESGRDYRPAKRPGVQPPAANRFPNTLLEVKPGITIACGQEQWRITGMLFAIIETFASLEVLHELRDLARAELDDIQLSRISKDTSLTAQREELSQRADTLAQLQLRLSFGVESYLHPRLLFADLPLQAFHSVLIELLQIQDAADATGRMLERLGAVLSGRSAQVAIEERELDERRQRRWSAGAVALATTAVPLSLVLTYLGASIAQVSKNRSVFSPSYFVAYGILIGSVLIGAAAVFAIVEYRAHRREVERRRVRARIPHGRTTDGFDEP